MPIWLSTEPKYLLGNFMSIASALTTRQYPRYLAINNNKDEENSSNATIGTTDLRKYYRVLKVLWQK